MAIKIAALPPVDEAFPSELQDLSPAPQNWLPDATWDVSTSIFPVRFSWYPFTTATHAINEMIAKRLSLLVHNNRFSTILPLPIVPNLSNKTEIHENKYEILLMLAHPTVLLCYVCSSVSS
jgi:hypothetical protein